MGITGHRRHSLTKGSQDESRPTSSNGEDETVVEPEQGNVLSHIISQLRPGADLSRVVLPTFILEPRSMLERITNFMAHPETLLPMPQIEDPVERFVSVVKFYLSGWHIKPPGVKKPLNPILGETFTAYWDYQDGTRGYYISEQTSHHPPKSSYFFMIPEHNIRIDGTLKPRSKFLGNSAASLMEGIAILRLKNHGKTPGGEKYFVTQPNMYARGILFGKMKYELGDHSFVRCPELGLAADLEFKTKGYFGGTYNAIGGTIKNEKTGEILYELSGMWNGAMHIKNLMTGHKELLFDATHAKPTIPTARPLEEQSDRESQKLWHATTEAINAVDHNAATDEKTKIEDMQREEAAQRLQDGKEFQPRLFRAVHGGPGGPEEGEEALDWILDTTIDGETPKEVTAQILAIAPILPGQKQSTKEPAQASVPPPENQAEQELSTQPQPQQQPQPQPQHKPQQTDQAPPAKSAPVQEDLIDLGSLHVSDKPKEAGLSYTPVPEQQSVFPTPPPQSQAQSTHHAALSELHHNHSSLARNPLQRTDTETSEVDEFVDAST